MTAKEFAEMLSGREVGMEITVDEERQAEDAGLVVVYGYSDDNMEFSGAIGGEIGAFEGTTVYVAKDGVFDESDFCTEDCPHCAAARKEAKAIKAVWHDEGGPCWTFETDIPHETFTIVEDGEPWCIGIVFSVEDLESCAHGKGR